MYFETYIADDSKKKLFDILGYPGSDSTAFSVMFELINRKTGEWKDKEVQGVSTSGCVKVSKKDILYYILLFLLLRILCCLIYHNILFQIVQV